MMSRSSRAYSICAMPEYPIRIQNGIPQLPLQRILFTHPASSSISNMGYSDCAKSKRRRYIPTEIWLQIIKCSMPSMISVSKVGRKGQNIDHRGFHLWLFFSKLPHVVNLAHVSKIWYMEVKKALYAQPLWSFDTLHCALSHFLSYDSVHGQARMNQLAEYDATISHIQHVHIGALRLPCFPGETSSAPIVLGGPRTPDYRQLHRLSLLQNLSHIYIDVGSSGFQEMGQAFKPNTAEGLEAALSAASDLIARFGKRFPRVISFHELSITKHPAQITDHNVEINREMVHNIKQDGFGMSTFKKDEFRTIVSKHVSAVLSKSSDLAASRSKEVEVLAMRHRYLVKLRASGNFPKAHIKLKVKILDTARWKYTASAPESAVSNSAVRFRVWLGSRPPRRAKSDAISRIQDLVRKRPRVV